MLTMLILGALVLLLVFLVAGAIAFVPSKSASATPLQALAEPLRPMVSNRPDPDEDRWRLAMAQWDAASRQSLRDRQLDEDAAAIAGEFRRISNERYLDSLRSDAAAYFSAPTTAKKSAT